MLLVALGLFQPCYVEILALDMELGRCSAVLVEEIVLRLDSSESHFVESTDWTSMVQKAIDPPRPAHEEYVDVDSKKISRGGKKRADRFVTMFRS